MKTTAEQRKELQELRGEATQGDIALSIINSDHGPNKMVMHRPGDRFGATNIRAKHADAKLLAAVVNALPDLLSDLAEAEQFRVKVGELVEATERVAIAGLRVNESEAVELRAALATVKEGVGK